MRPRKSRIRGTATEMNRSRNSHIPRRRSVTVAPTGIPSLSRKLEMDRRARVMTAFWPVITANSPATDSMSFRSRLPSPTPTFSVTLTTCGI